MKALAVSVLVVAPCFWARTIAAADLLSHDYNAWLVTLVKQGQLPGFRIAAQRTNVLFDVLLERASRAFGHDVATHVCVALVVLMFFWGTLAFVRAVYGRWIWRVAPIVAVLAYGYVLQQGLLNHDLSLGLSVAALACCWRGVTKAALASIPLLAIAAMAHPLPVLWATATIVYVWVARPLGSTRRVAIFLLSLAALVVVRWILIARYGGDWHFWQSHFVTGADQLWVFGREYIALGVALLLLCITSFVLDIRQRRSRGRFIDDLPVQLYVIGAAAVFLLPTNLHLQGSDAPLTAIAARLSLSGAILGVVVMAGTSSRRWLTIATTAVCIVFFAFLYRDVAAIDRAERKIESLVTTLPPGQRVVAYLPDPNSARLGGLSHLIDEACIGRCFSYGNYEAPSGYFRLRSTPQNRLVVAHINDAVALQDGRYIVGARDVPLYLIYRCGPTIIDVCLRPLAAGDVTR